MTARANDILRPLAALDPELDEEIRLILEPERLPVPEDLCELMLAETLWAIEQEISFGRALARGYAVLIAKANRRQIQTYRRLIHAAAPEGPTLARILAEHLVPVLACGDDDLLQRLMSVVSIMKAKGTFTLRVPLDGLRGLLESGDLPSARAYLMLLEAVFTNALNYGQCQHFATILPKAVLDFRPHKRAWQIMQWVRTVHRDCRLLEPFLAAMGKGLGLLSQQALEEFVSAATARFDKNAAAGLRFLALDSHAGLAAFQRLQVTVPLSGIRAQLNRYLLARTGFPLSVRSISSISTVPGGGRPTGEVAVCSKGSDIYLPDEIDRFSTRELNLQLYKALTRLESAYYEFHTVDFDFDKAADKILQFADGGSCHPGRLFHAEPARSHGAGDLDRFMALFPAPGLAGDLFTVFENTRIGMLLRRNYAGLWRMVRPCLQAEAGILWGKEPATNPLPSLYRRLVIGCTGGDSCRGVSASEAFVGKVTGVVRRELSVDPTVERSAMLLCRFYEAAEALASQCGDCLANARLAVPFGWRPWPNNLQAIYGAFEGRARILQEELAARGVRVYRSDIRKILAKNRGNLTGEDLRTIVPSRYLSTDVVDHLICAEDSVELIGSDDTGDDQPVFWYDEWADHLTDYLNHHVRVRVRLAARSQDGFYREVLKRRGSLVRLMRRIFEMLRPEGLEILRRWQEGDEFDYRALLDYAIERKAGLIPADRLYIKRVKHRRDVAVLLLVDISRSTANTVKGSDASVLEVEKEAIVLFSEALNVVGDRFAIAAYSGNGRLGVDFLWVKHFHEALDDAVKDRINSLRPLRNTRMGAAIRHAGCELERIPARVQMMIVLGDGFPNDVDYKGTYAAADTRQALYELRARNIHTHGITVNLPAAPQLDQIYGDVRHSILSDVRELPERLLQIYNSLTRY